MAFTEFYFYSLDTIIQLLLRVGAIVLAAYSAMRITFLRNALNGAQANRWYCATAIVFFAAWSIIGTYGGFVIDMRNGSVTWTGNSGFNLQEGDFAIIGIRDTIALAAGIFGGPWVGLGTGLLAGIHRYSLGGFAAATSALATVLLGLGAGTARHFLPRWALSIKGILAITLLGTLVQMLVQFTLLQPHNHAINLVAGTAAPFAVVNSLGCLLFLMLLKDLNWDILKNEAQRAQLRALQAQVEPHFLNNALNSIQALIGIDTAKASEYVGKLRTFLNYTRGSARENSITLAEELHQLNRYLEFQGLRFPDDFIYSESVPPSLLNCRLPPRSLQTLIENIFVHAKLNLTGFLEIRIEGVDLGKSLQLHVCDNGAGINEARKNVLCKRVVRSKQGSGSALFQLDQSLQLAFNGCAKIEIKSQKNVGTTITLNLPKRTQPW